MPSYWRLYDTQHETDTRIGEYLMHENTICALGEELPREDFTLTVDLVYLKTEVTKLATKAKYNRRDIENFDIEKVPEGTQMGPWKAKPDIAEDRGCAYFFVKYSKDKRYRIELEVN